MESTQFLTDSHNHLETIRASQFDLLMNCNQPIPLAEIYTLQYTIYNFHNFTLDYMCTISINYVLDKYVCLGI